MKALRDLTTDTMRGLGLLTRIRVASRWFVGFDGRYDGAARTFPIVGALLALPVAAVSAGAVALHLPRELSGLLGVLVLVSLTGALHEDGLADTSDGLGGRSRERRLEIMRDSAIGTYGILALLFAVGVRAVAIGNVFASPFVGAAATIAALAIGRTAMVWLWWRTAPARSDGAAAASGQPTSAAVRTAVALCALLAAPALLMLGPWRLLLAIALSALVVIVLRRHAMRALGGHTGDVLGACVVASECAVLIALAVALPAADMLAR